MQIYLPIADLPVNIFLVLGMGLAVGFISGMFGIGGGFLMTPLLIFVGISPAVAVASVSSHIAASSMSGAISYWRRRSIDPALAVVLLTGGSIGTALGVATFTWLRSLGQLDLLIALSYVILLTSVGGLMFWDIAEGRRVDTRHEHTGGIMAITYAVHCYGESQPLDHTPSSAVAAGGRQWSLLANPQQTSIEARRSDGTTWRTAAAFAMP